MSPQASRRYNNMTNIKSLKRICENGSGCAACPMRKLCDAMDDLRTALNGAYEIAGSVPGDWTMRQTKLIHDAMTRVLYEMEPKPEDVIRDYENWKEEALMDNLPLIEQMLNHIIDSIPDPFSRIALAMTLMEQAGRELNMTSEEMIANVFIPAFRDINEEGKHE